MTVEPATPPRREGVSVTWRGDREGVLGADGHSPIVGAPSLDAATHAWSPEELLCAAVLLGYLTTFFAWADRARIAVRSFRADAESAVDDTRDGPRVGAVRIHVDVETDDVARATELIDRAKWASVVSTALATPIVVESHVRGRR